MSPKPEPGKLLGNVLLTKSNAYVLLPVEVVSKGDVTDMWWSGDGRYLAYLRTVPTIDRQTIVPTLSSQPVPEGKEGREQIVIHTVGGRESVVYSGVEGSFSVNAAMWLPGSDSLAITITIPNETGGSVHTALIVSPSRGMTTLFQGDLDPQLLVSLTRPVGVLVAESASGASTLRGFGPNGWIGPVVDSGDESANYNWTGDGKRFVAYHPVKNDQGKSETTYSEVNLATGQTKPMNGNIDFDPSFPNIDLTVDTKVVPISTSTGNQSARMIWIEATDVPDDAFASHIFLSSDGDSPSVPRSLTAIAYRTRGAILMRRILKLPRAALESALVTAVRNDAHEKAKQSGLALLMYSNDYDNVWPDGTDFIDKVYPYVKSRSILEGFVYVFGGGPMDDPANTIIGYYPFPGGRVTVYGDGHTKVD